MSKISILILALSGYSANLMACQELNWDESAWTKNSESVYIVRVVGISVPEMLDVPYSTDSVREALVTSRMDKEVSLVVYETLKGKSQKKAKVLLNWCKGGEVKLGHVGVLYGLAKEWHVKLGINAIAVSKKALTKL